MFSEELASTFKGLVASFEFRDAEDARDARRQFGWEGRKGHGVLEGALGIGGEETYRRCGIERIREKDLAGFEPLFVYNVFFGRDDQPDRIGRVRDRLVRAIGGGVGKKVFGGRGGLFALRFRFHVFEECGGGFESLAAVSVFGLQRKCIERT